MGANINVNAVALGTACAAVGFITGSWGVGTTVTLGGVALAFLGQPALPPLRNLCQEIFNDFRASAAPYLNWRPLSIIPTCAVILSSGAGSYLVSFVNDGMTSMISGAAAGALSAAVYMYRNGMIHPMVPLPPPFPVPPPFPQALLPFNVAPDSLLHLNSPFDLEVSYGDSPVDIVYCPSVSIAVICSMLRPQYRRQHKTFFETVGRTPIQCLEFMLARPNFEIDPNFDFGIQTQFLNNIKFDVAPVASGQDRPDRTPNQRQSRDALLATDRRQIIYPPATYLTDGMLRNARDRAVALVVASPELNQRIADIYQNFRLQYSVGGVSRAAREAGAMAGAQRGARAGADRVLAVLLQADQAPAGVLIEGAFYGAVAGARAAIQHAINDPDIANQGASAGAGTAPGIEAGNEVVLRMPQKRPIIAHRNFPVDMAFQLTRIRNEVMAQDSLEAQQGISGRIPPDHIPRR